jgi:hypothetical protein
MKKIEELKVKMGDDKTLPGSGWMWPAVWAVTVQPQHKVAGQHAGIFTATNSPKSAHG